MKRWIGLAAAAWLAGGAFAKSWTVDHAASRLGFTAAMMGESFEGTFETWSAEIVFDPADLAGARASVTIDMTSARTGEATRDTALPTADWFDAGAHRQASFVTTSFRKTGENAYEADGDLTIRGTAKPVTLPFTLTVDGASATMSARMTVNRTDWGVGQGDWATGDEVALKVAIAVEIKAAAQ